MPLKSTPDRDICDPAAERALQPLPPAIAPGTFVDVRGARWQVDATVPQQDCHELRLSAARDREPCTLLWPFDRPVAVADLSRRPVKSVRLRRWCRVVASLVAAEIDPDTPRARASADVLDYQLGPAAAAAAGEPRILLADEVGLGKTIQAGWIVADCVARNHDARILIAVPAGLRRQWDSELRRFFAIEAAVADAAWLRRRVQSLPVDVNPWTPPGVYLASIDFLKRPDLLQSLEALIWDLAVVDEAHMAIAPSDRHAAVQQIARRARQVIAITATPYSGEAGGFGSIAALGGDDPPLMFRRSRDEIGDRRARRHRFATVALTSAERRLQHLLERYSREVWSGQSPDIQGARLAVTILRKRALSSPAAAVRSLMRRLELLRGNDPAPRQLSLLDDDDAIGADDDLPSTALSAPGLADISREQRILQALIDAAGHAVRSDSKQYHLTRLLRRLAAEAAIVFTEYRDTLLHLARAFPTALLLHGGLSTGERASVQEQFNESGGLLLATDAASCGLNLQARCRLVVNYELPWNPARLEQRIGRVDRIGQRRRVHAITLVARHTAEDLVIAPLTRRLERVASTLGERDRLASLLTDARTAGIVIGGAPVAEPDVSGTPPLARTPSTSSASRAAAARLRASHSTPVCHAHDDHAVAVARLRATPSLPEGVLWVVEATATTVDGFVVARRVVLLHGSCSQPKPRSAGDMRERAGLLLNSVPNTIAADELARWFVTTRQNHESAIDRRVERERTLLRQRTRIGVIQPGLFDGRALREAETFALHERDVDAQHHDRIAALDRSRALRLQRRLAAVLLSWR